MGKLSQGIVLKQDDRARLEESLSALLRSYPLRAAFVVRENGQLLMSLGRLDDRDRDSVSRVLAESWRMLQNLARTLGQTGGGPSYLLSSTGQTLVRVSPLGKEWLLALVCEDDPAAGTVTPHVAEASDHLRTLVEEIASRAE